MDILSYLTTLIKTHKEVGIPGLGTIYKRKSPGRYDVETHSFLPPSYTLNFTSDLKEQTLLSQLISKKKNISTDAATYFIEQFSQNVLDELAGHHESDFGELGTFSITSGSLTFVPKQDLNFGFDFYGLPTLKAEPELPTQLPQPVIEEYVETPAVKQDLAEENLITEMPAAENINFVPSKEILVEPEVTEEQLELENNNADLSDGTTDPLEEPASDEALIAHIDSTEQPVVLEDEVIQQPSAGHFTLDYSGQEKTGMPAYLKVIIGLAIILILAGVIYLAKPELFKTPPKNIPQAALPITTDTTQTGKNTEQLKIDSIERADSIRKSNEKAILAIDSAKDSAKVAVPSIQTTLHPVMSYDIIAASLLNMKEAEKFLEDMKKRGIPAKIAKMPGRRVKISIGSFTDEDTARKQLEILKKTTKIPGIYVTPIRHTNNPK